MFELTDGYKKQTDRRVSVVFPFSHKKIQDSHRKTYEHCKLSYISLKKTGVVVVVAVFDFKLQFPLRAPSNLEKGQH